MDYLLLGPLEVRDDRGTTVVIRGPKLKLLALRLLVARGRPVPVPVLIDDLWGGERSGLTDLVGQLAVLGRSLPRRLVAGPGGYALVAAAVTEEGEPGDSRDDDRAESAAMGARRALDAGHGDEAEALASTALTLWRGPVLHDAGAAPWAEPERDRLDVLRAELALLAVGGLLLGRRASAAVPVAERALELHPRHRRLHAALAAALLLGERPVDALRALHRARTVVASREPDAGPRRSGPSEPSAAGPGPELRAMELAVLAGDGAQARDLALRAPPSPSTEVWAGPVRGSDVEVGFGFGSEPLEGMPPDGVRGLVGDWIRWLPPQARRLLNLAAVSGGPIEVVLLARAGGLPPATVFDHLDPAVALGLITAEGGSITYRHPALRQAVVDGLAPFELERTGQLLSQAGTGPRGGHQQR